MPPVSAWSDRSSIVGDGRVLARVGGRAWVLGASSSL